MRGQFFGTGGVGTGRAHRTAGGASGRAEGVAGPSGLRAIRPPQAKPLLPAATQFQIDIGQPLRIQQGTVQCTDVEF